MITWKYTLRIKHLLTDNEDYESIQKSMDNIAEEIRRHFFMDNFSTNDFYKIPKSDNFFSSQEYANKLLDRLYDFADWNKIWII